MNVRTPDPNPGWLSDDDLFEARGRLPMVYVEAVPVRLDPLGFVNEVGTLLQADEDGNMIRSLVSGRVLYRETIRAALLRHMEKDLGPLAFPQLPISPVPFTVAEYFPSRPTPASPTTASTPSRWRTSFPSPANAPRARTPWN